jgi:hypothetical protein
MRTLRLLALALPVVLAGCGGPGVVDRAEVEKQTQEGLTKSVGQQAPKAECPDELKAEVGATTRCTMDFENGKKRLGITVKVSSVDGDDVKFAIQADDKLEDIE